MLDAPTTAGPHDTFFLPDAAIRRLHGEGVLLLGGGRALLMQIAHPAVARGVAEHSTYGSAKLSRLLRTLRGMLAIAYGTPEQALYAAAGINRLHERVSGEGYDALDPELLVWVLATLIDTTAEMYQRFLGPIPAEEGKRYYADMCCLGSLLQIPEGAMPAGLKELREYVETMSDCLTVSDQARSIARELFSPIHQLGPSMWLMKHFTSGLLHPALRDGFGLTWGTTRQRQLSGLQALSRATLPRLPFRLRRTPSFLLPPGASL